MQNLQTATERHFVELSRKKRRVRLLPNKEYTNEDIISSLVKKEVEAALGKYYESLINNASVNGGVE